MTPKELEQLNIRVIRFNGTREEYEQVKDTFNPTDIVYTIQPNAGIGYHLITLYKRPVSLTDWEVAYLVDGFFYNVINRGNDTLECWYD